MAAAMTADAATGGSTTAEEPRVKVKKDKSLSVKVLDAGLAGPRWIKRFVVKHKKGFLYALAAIFAAVLALYLGMMVMSFYAWLFTMYPILFWATIAVTTALAVYVGWMFYSHWPKGKINFTVQSTESASAPSESTTEEPTPEPKVKTAEANAAAPKVARGRRPANGESDAANSESASASAEG